MWQALLVLRGCVVAYLVAAATVWTLAALQTTDPPQMAAILLFGLYPAIPASIAALVIWAVLSVFRVRVAWWGTMLLGAAAGTWLLIGTGDGVAAGAGPNAEWLLPPVIGAASGAVVWFGAFGLRRSVRLGWRMPPQ